MANRKINITEDIIIDYGFSLGSGAYGDVFRGMWKSRNCFVAIKKIKKEHEDADSMMEQEVKIMEKIQHENVLSFLALLRKQDGLYLIIQYCEGGSLEGQIKKQAIPAFNCYQYAKQMIFAMAQVNKLHHIHRDLKPQNILFTKYKVLKICDFGLARRIIGDDVNKMQKHSAKGSPLYASPQLLNGLAYSGKCDVWSAGVVIIEMLTKKCPTYNATQVFDQYSLMKYQKKMTQKTGHYVLEGNYHNWFKQIARQMIAYEQHDRLSFQQLKDKIIKNDVMILQQLGGFGDVTKKIDPNKVISNNTHTLDQSIVKVVAKQPNATYDELEQANKKQKLANALQVYVKFIYNRSKVYVDMATKFYQLTQNKLNGAIKYLILAISIGIYIKTIDYLLNLIQKVKSITLPDGHVIEAGIFKLLDESYIQNLSDQRSKFNETLTKIIERLSSEKYVSAYGDFIEKYSSFILQLKKVSNCTSKQDLQYFHNQYYKLFFKQCTINIQQSQPIFLRTYFIAINLMKIETTFPVKNYADNYAINRLIDDSSTTDIEQIKQKIVKIRKEQIAIS